MEALLADNVQHSTQQALRQSTASEEDDIFEELKQTRVHESKPKVDTSRVVVHFDVDCFYAQVGSGFSSFGVQAGSPYHSGFQSSTYIQSS